MATRFRYCLVHAAFILLIPHAVARDLVKAHDGTGDTSNSSEVCVTADIVAAEGGKLLQMDSSLRSVRAPIDESKAAAQQDSLGQWEQRMFEAASSHVSGGAEISNSFQPTLKEQTALPVTVSLLASSLDSGKKATPSKQKAGSKEKNPSPSIKALAKSKKEKSKAEVKLTEKGVKSSASKGVKKKDAKSSSKPAAKAPKGKGKSTAKTSKKETSSSKKAGKASPKSKGKEAKKASGKADAPKASKKDIKQPKNGKKFVATGAIARQKAGAAAKGKAKGKGKLPSTAKGKAVLAAKKKAASKKASAKKKKRRRADEEADEEAEDEELDEEERAAKSGYGVIGSVVFLMSAPAGMLLVSFMAFLWVRSQDDAEMGG